MAPMILYAIYKEGGNTEDLKFEYGSSGKPAVLTFETKELRDDYLKVFFPEIKIFDAQITIVDKENRGKHPTEAASSKISRDFKLEKPKSEMSPGSNNIENNANAAPSTSKSSANKPAPQSMKPTATKASGARTSSRHSTPSTSTVKGEANSPNGENTAVVNLNVPAEYPYQIPGEGKITYKGGVYIALSVLTELRGNKNLKPEQFSNQLLTHMYGTKAGQLAQKAKTLKESGTTNCYKEIMDDNVMNAVEEELQKAFPEFCVNKSDLFRKFVKSQSPG